jgi:hypothetical protein
MNSVMAGWAWSRSQVNNAWWLRAAVIAGVVTLLGLVLEHRAASSASRDNALLAHTFGLIVPLLAFSATARAFPHGIVGTFAPLAGHGANRRHALLGSMLYLALGTCAVALLSSFISIALGASGNASVPSDTFACLWISALGAAGYTAWFLLASSFGRRGQGRFALLGVDWLLGAGASSLAAAWPRGHLRNLLGGQPVANLEQPVAALVLGLLVLVYLTVSLLRTPR